MSQKPGQLTKGVVFNIQKYSVHDGPGIRTIIFLKGCSLRCHWCSNPESQAPSRQLAYNEAKCLSVEACQRCRDICPRGALAEGPNGKMAWNQAACDDCLKCAEACPSLALNVYGYEVTVDGALSRVEEDGVFYARSGGGLTLSGGEPLFQAEFAIALLREARRRRIDTCIETCGNVPWPVLDEAANHLNSVLYDIKSMDVARHQGGTGVSNELILSNLTRLRQAHAKLPITARTPVIPGFNDSEGSIGAIVDFVAGLPGVEYELLAYHRMGSPKYGYLGREYCMVGGEALAEGRFAELSAFARERLASRRRAATPAGAGATPEENQAGV